MKKLLISLMMVFLTSAALAQSIGGNTSITAGVSNSRQQLTASASQYPATLLVPAVGTAVDVHYAFGIDNTIVATLSSPTLPPGGLCFTNIAASIKYLAAITASSTAVINVTQLSQCPQPGSGGGGSAGAGGGGGSATAALQSNVQSAAGGTSAAVLNVQGNASGTPIPVTGTFSTVVAGFMPSSVGTPLAVTTGGVTGALPAGITVVAFNVGTTNIAYCQLGASASTASTPIAPNGGWFAYDVGVATQISCITSASTTTVNLIGGAGLPAGSNAAAGGVPIAVVSQPTASLLNATVVGTGTFATQLTGATNDIRNVTGTVSLPTNAATGPLQTTGNNTLTTINTTLGSPFQAGGSIGNTSFGVSGTLPAFAATPTVNLGTIGPGSTAALQTTGNTALTTINTTLGTPFQAGGLIGNASFGISGTLPAFAVTPTVNLGTIGAAATAAAQATGNTSLSNIDTANGTIADAAWSGSGNSTQTAALKKIALNTATASASIIGFTPTPAYAVPMAVTNVSSNIALPAGTTVLVYNVGSKTTYTTIGTGAPTATTSDEVIQPGCWFSYAVGANTRLAAITGSALDTTTLNLSGGSGVPVGGCSAQGSAVTLNAPPNDIISGPTARTTPGSVSVSASGSGSVGIQVTGGGFTGNFVFEATEDGTNWFAVNGYTPTGTIVAGGTAAGNWVIPASGFTQVRVRYSALTGTATTTLNASAASVQQPVGTQGVTTNLSIPPNDIKIGPTAFTVPGTLPVSAAGSGSVGVQVTGSFTGSFVFEATEDGTTWFGVNGYTPGGVIVAGGNAAGNWVVPASGFSLVRLNITALSAGTATATVNASAASVQQPVGTQGVTSNDPGVIAAITAAAVPVPLQTTNDPCGFPAKVNVPISTASGTTALVTGVAAKKIYVCSFALITPTAVSVSLSEGSGATCGTSAQAGVMGVGTNGTAANGMPLPANGGLTYGNGSGTVASTATAANYLCLFQSGTAQIAGNLTYVQQ